MVLIFHTEMGLESIFIGVEYSMRVLQLVLIIFGSSLMIANESEKTEMRHLGCIVAAAFAFYFNC